MRRANEKGHVERLIGFARRNFLVPAPQVKSLAVLNQQLGEQCMAALDQRTRGKPAPKSELLCQAATSLATVSRSGRRRSRHCR